MASAVDPSADLPDELKCASIPKLQEVSDALAVLQEAGLTDIAGVEALSKQVRSVTDFPVDSFLTQCMKNNLWTWTPDKWWEAEHPKVHFELKGEDKAAMAERLQEQAGQRLKMLEDVRKSNNGGFAAEASVREATARRRQCLDGFINSHLAAAQELDAFADPDYAFSESGVGEQVFFFKMDGLAPIPPVPRSKRLVRIPAPVPASPLFGVSGAPALGTCTPARNPVVSVHIGGAGIGMGVSLYERVLSEHGIGMDGFAAQSVYGIASTHFDETQKGRFLPRAVLVDADAATLDQARNLKALAPTSFYGTGSPTIERRFGEGKEMYRLCDLAEEELRQQAEKADNMNAIFVTHAATGGVGSGLTEAMLERINVQFGKKFLWACTQMPSSTKEDDGTLTDGRAVVNAVMSVSGLLEHTTLNTWVDKPTLRTLATDRLGLASPADSDFNAMVARVIAAVTSPTRIGSLVPAGTGVRQLTATHMMALIPYPRIHFTVPAVAPLSSETNVSLEDGEVVAKALVEDTLACVDFSAGKHIAVGLFCRGMSHYLPLDRVMEWRLRGKADIVDWSPNGVQIASHLDQTAPSCGEAIALHNTTAIGPWLRDIFDRAKNSEEQHSEHRDDYAASSENIAALLEDFREVSAETVEEEEDEYEEE